MKPGAIHTTRPYARSQNAQTLPDAALDKALWGIVQGFFRSWGRLRVLRLVG